MLFKGFKRTDRWIVAVAALIFVISMMFIVDDRWLIRLHSQDTAGLEQIGEISNAQNDVRRRYKIAMTWLPVERQDQIFQGDRIFTGDSSTATIRTAQGEEIFIAANSLVVIRAQENSLLLNIDYGSVQGRVDKDKKLLIASKDGVAEFSGSEGLIDVQVKKGKALKVNVLQGEVKVKSAQKTTTLTKDDSTELELPHKPVVPLTELPKPLLKEQDPIPKSEPPVLVWPKRDEVIMAASPKPSVPLKWKGKSKQGWEVEVAETNNFADAKKLVVNADELAIELPKTSTYYWRVRPKDSSDVEWSTASFVLKMAPPPEVVPEFTKSNVNFELETSIEKESKAATVRRFPKFSWNEVGDASEFEIQISANRDFTDTILRKKISEASFTWREPKAGAYFARVRALRNGRAGKFSTPLQMKISLAPPTSEIASEATEEVPELNLMNTPPPPFDLRWKATALTSFYELHFSPSPDFSRALKVVTSTPHKKVQAPQPGTYYWRVRSLDSGHQPISKFSPEYSYTFSRIYRNPEKEGQLRALYPKPMQSIVVVGSGQDKIQFRWTMPFENTTYRVQLSAAPEFNDLLIDKTVTKNWMLVPANFPEGWIYWRLRAENGDTVTAWTITNRFELVYQNKGFDLNQPQWTPPPSPEISQVKPAKKREPSEQKRDPMAHPPTELFAATHFTINTLVSEESRQIEKIQVIDESNKIYSAPTLSWSPAPPLSISVLEIAKDEKFVDRVLTRNLTESSFDWMSFQPGRYFWRVAYKNAHGRRTDFSASKQFDIVLPAPVSLTPAEFTEHYPYPRAAPKEPEPFILKWQPVAFAHSYALEFARDKEFKDVKRLKSLETSERIKVTRPGEYYWRVRALDKNGKPLSAFSVAYEVKVLRTFTTMVSPPPIGFPDKTRLPAEENSATKK